MRRATWCGMRSRASCVGLRVSFVLALACGLSPACRGSEPRAPRAQTQHAIGAADSATAAITPYAAARWRLSEPGALDHVVLWVSHILIRHDSASTEVPFLVAGWHGLPPPPLRSRDQALSLSLSLEKQAQAEPTRFAALASEHSEDVMTKGAGGSLGAITASQFLREPAVLDAISALTPGQVSRVVETRYGFHLLHKRAVPTEQRVSARRVVVRHALSSQAQDASGTWPSRAAALATAKNLTAELRQDPERLPKLLQQYPPAADAADDGDIGVWSTHEPGLLSRERERLAALAEGEVSEPIEGPEGFQVFVRSRVEPRPEYTMQLIKLSFDQHAASDAPDHPQRVAALAGSIREVLARDPGQHAFFARKYCCEPAERWQVGRTPRALLEAAAQLGVGEVASTPWREGSQYVIARRMPDASAAPGVPTTFELPSPDAPDVLRVAARFRGPAVQKLIRGLAEESLSGLGLEADLAQRFLALHDELASAFGMTEPPHARDLSLRSFTEALSVLLTPEQYQRYEHAVTARVTQRLMELR